MARAFAALTLAVALVLLLPAEAAAQYFGRNIVRSRDLDFQVMKTEHFDIYYYDRSERMIGQAARLAERWYARLSEILGHRLSQRQPLVLYATAAEFQQTTVIQGGIGEGTGGVTEALRNRVVLPFTASLADTDHVLGHELVHAFQFDMTRGRALRLPLWFVEGLAEYLSLGPVHAPTAMWLRDAALREDLPGFDDLADPSRFPYRFGHAAWAYLAGRFGDDAIAGMFIDAADAGDPAPVLQGRAGTDLDALSAAWHASIQRTYADLETEDGGPAARTIIAGSDEGAINVGPALSPDGRQLVFFSERDQFSIEMFLADADSGRVLRKLSQFATNPHVDRLQFLQSTGAWRRDGRQFAYTTVRNATPVLTIVEPSSGRHVREISLPTVGDAMNLTWSPDGRRVAFSGMQGGASDLFVYDVEQGQLRRLTDDLFMQIQPDWSPDGRSLVVVTDQFTTALDALDVGPPGLALVDVETGAARALAAGREGPQTNPRWSPDGRHVYFIGAPNGIPNVFRLVFATGAVAPLTDLRTGVSGITETSPALDVARASGRLAFSVFDDNRYSIVALDDPAALPGVPLRAVSAATLPSGRTDGAVATAVDAPLPGLPPPQTTFPSAPYQPSLSLEYAGAAASTGFNASALGTTVNGGVALQFGDLLNVHQVTAVVAASARSVKDLGGSLMYLNRSTRWNLGGVVDWVPYVSGSFSQQLGQVDGRTVIVERERLLRQTNRQVLGLAHYPFNRATRVEVAAGLRSIGFDRETTTRVFALDGQFLDEVNEDLEAPDALNMVQTTGAFVYDTSIFGVASPLVGSRARLEVTPTFGSLRFTELLADVRRYATPLRPLTFAGRVLHVGRYGRDGEDQRLSPLYLGYPTLVRGYDVNSFGSDECVADATSDCPAFDQLVGSRLVVGSVELRAPLVGLFTGRLEYGALPIEAFLFGDAGMAWAAADSETFTRGDLRRWVRSAGVGLRANAFGAAVLELAFARPFDRPDRGWRFVFNIVPGF